MNSSAFEVSLNGCEFFLRKYLPFKLSCDSRSQRAFTACVCVFKVIMLAWTNQGNYFENTNACCKRTLKTTVATQLNILSFTGLRIFSHTRTHSHSFSLHHTHTLFLSHTHKHINRRAHTHSLPFSLSRILHSNSFCSVWVFAYPSTIYRIFLEVQISKMIVWSHLKFHFWIKF